MERKEESQGKHDIEVYQFNELAGSSGKEAGVYDYDTPDLEDVAVHGIDHMEPTIRVEREMAKKANFEILNFVKEYRGLKRQEDEDRKKEIEKEVEKKVELMKEDAFQEGYEKGVKLGKEEAFVQFIQKSKDLVEELKDIISEVKAKEDQVFRDQKKEIYELVKTLTKWVILREIKDDDDYVMRLLDRIILHVQDETNILVKVNKKQFENKERILETIKETLGPLKNARVEVEHEMDGPGIILESESGIINGSLEQQLQAIDDLFSKLEVYEEQ